MYSHSIAAARSSGLIAERLASRFRRVLSVFFLVVSALLIAFGLSGNSPNGQF